MSSPWSIAARFRDIGEAQAARSALDAAGIECTLADENLVSVDWGASQAVGGVKVMVRAEDLEEARAILFQSPLPLAGAPHPPSGQLLPQAGEGTPSHQCPDCGSPDAQPIPRFRLFALIALAFIGVGVAVGEPLLAVTALIAVAAGVLLMPTHRCQTCGTRWNKPLDQRSEAPLPDPADTIETPCPRCGSLEVHHIDYRRMKALPLLFNPAIFVVFPIWLARPKRRCENCGLEMR